MLSCKAQTHRFLCQGCRRWAGGKSLYNTVTRGDLGSLRVQVRRGRNIIPGVWSLFLEVLLGSLLCTHTLRSLGGFFLFSAETPQCIQAQEIGSTSSIHLFPPKELQALLALLWASLKRIKLNNFKVLDEAEKFPRALFPG